VLRVGRAACRAASCVTGSALLPLVSGAHFSFPLCMYHCISILKMFKTQYTRVEPNPHNARGVQNNQIVRIAHSWGASAASPTPAHPSHHPICGSGAALSRLRFTRTPPFHPRQAAPSKTPASPSPPSSRSAPPFFARWVRGISRAQCAHRTRSRSSRLGSRRPAKTRSGWPPMSSRGA